MTHRKKKSGNSHHTQRKAFLQKHFPLELMSNQILALEWVRKHNNKNSIISSTGISGNPYLFSVFGSNETSSFHWMWNKDLELYQSNQNNRHSWTSYVQGTQGKERWLGGHISCFVNLSPPSSFPLLALWPTDVIPVWHYAFWVCLTLVPFGLEKQLKGLFFKKLVLDYILLTKTFFPVVMATFILQELDVISLEVWQADDFQT